MGIAIPQKGAMCNEGVGGGKYAAPDGAWMVLLSRCYKDAASLELLHLVFQTQSRSG